MRFTREVLQAIGYTLIAIAAILLVGQTIDVDVDSFDVDIPDLFDAD